ARSERRLPLPLLSASVLLLGLSSFQPFVLRRPSVYEVAVAAGYCFLSAAGYFLLRSMEDTRGSAVSLALASLCLGLAVGSRPNHIVAAPLLLLAWARRRSPADLARALGPLAACIFLLLLYNRARFGDWLEFGQHYVLASHRAPGAMLFSVIYLPSHALAYLFWPVVPALEFPFFHLR